MGRQKTGRIGKQKIYYQNEYDIEIVKDRAKRTGKSESAVISELMYVGLLEFDKRYGLDKETQRKKEAESKKEDNEKTKDKGEKIADAYGKRLLNPEYTEGWEEQ